MAVENEPLFLLAPPRSFTSLVNAMLGQHPMMYGFPELNLFLVETMEEFWSGISQNGNRKSSYWPMMRHGLMRVVAQLFGGNQTLDTVSMAYRWIMVRKDIKSEEIYYTLCRKIAPLIPVEKSPAYIGKMEYLQRLYQAFPKARFIHLVRNPRGQCESILKVKGGVRMLLFAGSVDLTGKEPIIDPQIAWHDGNVQIMDFLDILPDDRWIRIKGEDMLADPDKKLADICRWLGLPAGGSDIEAMKHPEDSPYAFVGPVNARLGNDINFLKAPSMRPFKAKKYDLEEPLPWRSDKKPFYPQVLQLAKEFGYL